MAAIQAALTPEQQAQFAGSGVPLADLPKEITERMMWVVQSADALWSLSQLRRAMPDVLGRAVVHVQNSPRLNNPAVRDASAVVSVGGAQVADWFVTEVK